MINRFEPPAFKTPEKIPVVRAESQTLANGIRLHWLRAGEQPIVRMEFIFRAGTWYESQNGVSYFTVKMLNEGTRNRTAKQINEYFDQFGAFLEFNHGVDRINISVYTLTKHVARLLPVLQEILFESVFPESELQTLKTITLQNLRVNLEKTAYLAQMQFKERLFGEQHPYGRNLTEDAIRAVQTPELHRHYETSIRYQAGDIVLSGLIDDTLLALVRNAFETTPVQTTPVQTTPPSEMPLPAVTAHQGEALVDRPDSLQSSIRMGTPLFTRRHPDYFHFLVLNEVLGGYFGSRLMRNIREEKGFTYGISSNVVTLRHLGYLVIGTDVRKEFTGQTIAEIRNEIIRLQTELIPDDELQTVKNYMVGSFAGSLTTPFELADRFKTIYFDELPYEFYDQYVDGILHVMAPELRELAERYLPPDDMLAVIVGGK